MALDLVRVEMEVLEEGGRHTHAVEVRPRPGRTLGYGDLAEAVGDCIEAVSPRPYQNAARVLLWLGEIVSGRLHCAEEEALLGDLLLAACHYDEFWQRHDGRN